jgi:hypothetical protein
VRAALEAALLFGAAAEWSEDGSAGDQGVTWFENSPEELSSNLVTKDLLVKRMFGEDLALVFLVSYRFLLKVALNLSSPSVENFLRNPLIF